MRALVLLALCCCNLQSAIASEAEDPIVVSGRVDLAFGRVPGDGSLRVFSSAPSRFGIRILENIDDSTTAFARVETRFALDTGTMDAGRPFWDGASYVGLRHDGLTVTFGRQDHPAYELSQTGGDPFNAQSLAAMDTIVKGRVGEGSRWDDAIKLHTRENRFDLAVMSAARPSDGQRPYALGARYRDSQTVVGVGIEHPPVSSGRWATASISNALGNDVIAGIFIGQGRNKSLETHRGAVAWAKFRVGSQDFTASYGKLTNTTTGRVRDHLVGLGVQRSWRRVQLYGSVVYDRRPTIDDASRRIGVEIGMRLIFSERLKMNFGGS